MKRTPLKRKFYKLKRSPLKNSLKHKKVSTLKNKAWKLCSEYTRRKYADKNGLVKCITCGTIGHWRTMQASHLVAGRGNSILFDERGIYPACMRCNIFKGGNLLMYMKFLENKLGVKEAIGLRDELIMKSRIPLKRTAEDYGRLILYFKKKLEKYVDNNSKTK